MSKFTNLVKPFVAPAPPLPAVARRFIVDAEADGLLYTATKAHCLVILDLNTGQVYEYGPGQINAGLAHLVRANELIGHNILTYDLPLLKRLCNWAPAADCKITDTLIASRLILPDIAALDDQAAGMGDPKLGVLRGRHSLEAWGARLGMPKVGADITDWSVWTPEMQARCVADTVICRALYRLLQPDGYSQEAVALEHHAAVICERITNDACPSMSPRPHSSSGNGSINGRSVKQHCKSNLLERISTHEHRSAPCLKPAAGFLKSALQKPTSPLSTTMCLRPSQSFIPSSPE
jgi:hypothetical protein